MQKQIESLDGAVISLFKAQAYLATLEGDIDFDTLMFARKKISEAFSRIRAMRKVLALEGDPSSLSQN